MDIHSSLFGVPPARVLFAEAWSAVGKRLPRKGRVIALAPLRRKDLRLELVERFIMFLEC
jgi:hypothetical protein